MKRESLDALGAVPVDLDHVLKDTENEPGIPLVLHQGRYRLYEKPDGSLRIQYRRDGSDHDDHVELPGVMVRMAKAAAEGKMNPLQMMREVMKLNGEK